MEVCVENAPRSNQSTHNLKKNSGEDLSWRESWDLLETTHGDLAEHVYGVRPLPPRMSRDDREAMAKCLEGVAAEIRAKVHSRTGIERDLDDVRRDLAERTLRLYFKRKNKHLESVSHALPDLYREFHPRITQAMQEILRETHDLAPPRKAPVEPATPEARAEQERALAVVESFCGSITPPGESRRVDVAELNAVLGVVAVEEVVEAVEANDVDQLDAIEPEPPTPESARTAAPETPAKAPEPPREVHAKPREVLAPPEVRTWTPFRTASPRQTEALERLRRELGEDAPPSIEPPAEETSSPVIERALGRIGAPRWGSTGPRPVKRRIFPHLTDPEEEGGETPTDGPKQTALPWAVTSEPIVPAGGFGPPE